MSFITNLFLAAPDVDQSRASASPSRWPQSRDAPVERFDDAFEVALFELCGEDELESDEFRLRRRFRQRRDEFAFAFEPGGQGAVLRIEVADFKLHDDGIKRAARVEVFVDAVLFVLCEQAALFRRQAQRFKARFIALAFGLRARGDGGEQGAHALEVFIAGGAARRAADQCGDACAGFLQSRLGLVCERQMAEPQIVEDVFEFMGQRLDFGQAHHA